MTSLYDSVLPAVSEIVHAELRLHIIVNVDNSVQYEARSYITDRTTTVVWRGIQRQIYERVLYKLIAHSDIKLT